MQPFFRGTQRWGRRSARPHLCPTQFDPLPDFSDTSSWAQVTFAFERDSSPAFAKMFPCAPGITKPYTISFASLCNCVCTYMGGWVGGCVLTIQDYC